MNITHLHQLQHRSREDHRPFTLSIQGKELICRKILRLLPGKRMTVEAEFENTSGVAKIFYENRKAEKAFHYEQSMHDTLKTLGFDIPHCLFAKPSDLKQVYITLYEKVENKNIPLDFYYFEQLNSLISKLHQQKLIHIDPHPDNFLFDGQHFVLVDFSAIQRAKSTQALLENLALFYSQFPAYAIPFIPKLSDHYAEISNRIEQARWLRGRNYLKKLFRNTSDLKRLTHHDHLIMLERKFDTPELREFLRTPKKHLKNARLLKAGNTSTVFLTEISGLPIVVKRFNIKNPFHFLKYLFKPTRAYRNWQNSHLLQLFGIRTPAPVAMIEHRILFFRLTSYYLSAFEPGRLLSELSALVNHPDIAKKMDAVLQELKALKITHGDMKASNFITNEQGVSLLDLDAMTWHKKEKSFRLAWKKDRERLAKNWKHIKPQKPQEIEDVFIEQK